MTILILYICQIQSFILPEINLATQTNDLTKLETLGPFDCALDEIIEEAQTNRSDIEKYDCSKQHDLWRCGGMTASEIEKFTDRIGKGVYIPGYTSCLLDKSKAMSFAWEDATTGH